MAIGIDHHRRPIYKGDQVQRNVMAHLWVCISAFFAISAWLLGEVSPIHAQNDPPLASAWAKQTISLVQLGQHDEFAYAISGSTVAYLFGATTGHARCPTATQIRFYDTHTQKMRIAAQAPRTTERECWYYSNIAMSSLWLTCGLYKVTAQGTTLSVLALNRRTGQTHILSIPSRTMLSVSTTTVTGASLSDHELAWSLLDERAGELSERIVLQDLSNGHEQVVVTTPWFRFSDPQAERIRSVSLSGQRIVWTSLVGRAANMMLYDARTKHTIALTHDNTSLAGQIYGDTVAWLTSKSRQPEGTIEILDLRSNHVFTMQGVGFNIQIGNGLVSWTPAYTDVVPLYFVNRRALRFYRPIAKGENIPNVLIFGREVLVPVTTQFGTRSESAAMLHLDVY